MTLALLAKALVVVIVLVALGAVVFLALLWWHVRRVVGPR